MAVRRANLISGGTTEVAEAERGSQDTVPSRGRIKGVKGNYSNGLELTQHDFLHVPKTPTKLKVGRASLKNKTNKNGSTSNKMVATADLINEICVREGIPEDRQPMFKQDVVKAIREAKLDTRRLAKTDNSYEASDFDSNTRVIVDETIAKSIEWPTEKFYTAPEKGKHGGLVSFLRRVWKPVLDEHNVVMPLSIFAKKDDEAAKSIYTLRRAKKKLPPDLFILVEAEVTEMRIATDPKGLAKQLIAGRRARARIPGMLKY